MPNFSRETIDSWTGYEERHLEEHVLDRPTTEISGVQWLDYVHYSVLMDPQYRQPLVAALNVDQGSLVSTDRLGTNGWDTDPRIDDAAELNHSIYSRSGYSRGHMAMRSNASWGEKAQEASDSTFYFPNSCPQKQSFNGDEWLGLEMWAGRNTPDTTNKIAVFSGPIFASRTNKVRSSEPTLRGVEVPAAFFKIVCFIVNEDTLNTRAYIVPTEEAAFSVLDDHASHIDESFHSGSLIFQVSVAEIEEMTLLQFPAAIANANPIRRGERFVVHREDDLVTDMEDDNDPRRPRATEPMVRIISAMPKPLGGGHDKEWVTVQNLGDAAVDLSGITLSDNNGSVDLGSLRDRLEYGESLTVHQLGGMMLSNRGELLSLKDVDQKILHQVRYTEAEEGRAVVFG